MDFDLSEDQRLLSDSLARLLGDRYSFEARRGYAAEPPGWSREMWGRFAELGLLGLPFAEADGGFGGSAVDLMLVMEAFGGAMVLEPYLSSVVLGGAALRLAGSDAQRGALVPWVADGSRKLAFAHAERAARHDLGYVATTARRSAGGWVLDGSKSVVLHGDSADLLVVSARIGGERDDPDGLGLFLVDPAAAGVARRFVALHDATRAAEIALSGVVADATLGEPGEAMAVIERITEAGIAAVCAEAVGAMAAMQALTVDYLKTRTQFGRPIGANQALQHKAAEMLIALEQARSMAMLAAMMVDEPDAAERARSLSMAKVQIGRSARFLSQAAVQLHGGIGMTEEYAIGHFFRKTMVIEALFGDTAHHLALLAA